eukprot:1330412-Lingulodinium_polyedra.AAC.1
MREELWRRTIDKLLERVAQLLARPASPATRAAQWNSYAASALLYPAHVDLPTKRAQKEMEATYGRAGRTTGWAPCFVLGAIT